MTLNLSPLYRGTVGFDQYADLLSQALSSDSGVPSHPPFNIEKRADDAYRITLAVAGFSESDLSISVQENSLVVSANREANDNGHYLHQGISPRSFEKRFLLADHVKVTDAVCQDGLLHVNLVREIPEALKPREIEIAWGKAIESKPAQKRVTAA